MAKPSEHQDPRRPMSREEAERLAQGVRGLGSASRLLLMWAMLDVERTVEELGEQIQLEQSAVSHHLKILRDLGLVTTRREGRFVYYALHDHHLPDLLGALRHHYEHVVVESAADRSLVGAVGAGDA